MYSMHDIQGDQKPYFQKLKNMEELNMTLVQEFSLQWS